MRTIATHFTLRPYERGIQETLGKYTRFVLPGLGMQLLWTIGTRHDIREHTMSYAEMITKTTSKSRSMVSYGFARLPTRNQYEHFITSMIETSCDQLAMTNYDRSWRPP